MRYLYILIVIVVLSTLTESIGADNRPSAPRECPPLVSTWSRTENSIHSLNELLLKIEQKTLNFNALLLFLANKGIENEGSLFSIHSGEIKALIASLSATGRLQALKNIGELYATADRTNERFPRLNGRRVLDRLIAELLPPGELIANSIAQGESPAQALASYRNRVRKTVFSSTSLGFYSAADVIGVAQKLQFFFRHYFSHNPEGDWTVYMFGSFPNFKALKHRSDIDVALRVNTQNFDHFVDPTRITASGAPVIFSHHVDYQLIAALNRSLVGQTALGLKVDKISSGFYIPRFAWLNPIVIEIKAREVMLNVYSGRIDTTEIHEKWRVVDQPQRWNLF